MEKKTNNYVFEDINDLVKYIIIKMKNDSHLRLQKTLYLAYAYYSATLGTFNESDDTELQESFPRELCKCEFEAWKYGPVEKNVYTLIRDNLDLLENKEVLKEEEKMIEYLNRKNLSYVEKETLDFLDGIIEGTNKVNDFGLVERTHKDKAWREPFEQGNGGNHIKIGNDKIISEYIKKVQRS